MLRLLFSSIFFSNLYIEESKVYCISLQPKFWVFGLRFHVIKFFILAYILCLGYVVRLLTCLLIL